MRRYAAKGGFRPCFNRGKGEDKGPKRRERVLRKCATKSMEGRRRKPAAHGEGGIKVKKISGDRKNSLQKPKHNLTQKTKTKDHTSLLKTAKSGTAPVREKEKERQIKKSERKKEMNS